MNKKRYSRLLKGAALSFVLVLLAGVLFSSVEVKADNFPGAEIGIWSGFRKGAASFTFDDGAPSHVSDCAPVFDKYGYKATFNLVVNWNPDWSGFQGLADNGHEIGSHSNSHGSNMSGEEESSKKNIQSKITQKYGCITVAYPNCNVPNESAVLQNYIVGRICNGSWQSMSDTMGKDGPSNWARTPAIMTGSEGTVKTTNDFTSQMSKVVQNNGWVCFMTHGFQGKSNGSATYSPTDLNAIEGALKWAQQNDKDIWIAPMGHVAMYIRERKASKIEGVDCDEPGTIKFELTHGIADSVSNYDYPLSIRVKWDGSDEMKVTQGEESLKTKLDGGYLYFDAVPNAGEIVITDLQAVVAAPELRVSLSEEMDSREVTMASETSGCKIYYTTNGDEPTAYSTEYTGPLTIKDDRTTTIKAVAIYGGKASAVTKQTFTFHEIQKAELPEHSLWGHIPAKGYEGEQIRFYLNMTPAGWEQGNRLQAIVVKDAADQVTEITKCIMGSEMSEITPKTDEEGYRNYVPQFYTMPESDVEISAQFIIDPSVSEQKPADGDKDKDEGKTQQETDPASGGAKPDEGEQKKPAAKGETITDPASKASFLVTSGEGEKPAVEYAAAPKSKNKKITVPATVTADGITYQVTAIGKGAFQNNKYVKTIVIPASVKRLGNNLFKGCKKLKLIIVKTKKLTTKSVKSRAFKGVGKKVKIQVPKAKKKAYKKLFRKKGLSKKVKIKS